MIDAIIFTPFLRNELITSGLHQIFNFPWKFFCFIWDAPISGFVRNSITKNKINLVFNPSNQVATLEGKEVIRKDITGFCNHLSLRGGLGILSSITSLIKMTSEDNAPLTSPLSNSVSPYVEGFSVCVF